jgi:NitT/TauT family transport system substrate-binding protein
MRIRLGLSSLAAAVWLILVGVAHAEPLRISYFIWVGNGPFFVAKEKGLFAKEGVEVELINVEDHTTAFAGLFIGQVDAVQGAMPDAPTFAQPDEEPLVCVLALDDSRGDDGVLATKDIQTIADLKGRSVAVLPGSISHFYLMVLLKEAGLGEADIEIVDLPAEDAAQAFSLREVEAAVTNDAFLAQARSAGHGHLLTDTREQPGLLVDCLMTRADVFADRKRDFQAVARAWDAAVKYSEAHPDEANEIMARHLGGGLDLADFAKTLKGVGFYDAERNRAYFGTPDQPGPIYRTMQQAIDVWSSIGMLKMQVSPADVIRHGIWDE